MPPGEFRIQFDSDQGRVDRGGSWDYPADLAPSAGRFGSSPGYRYNLVGFRLCRDADYPKHTKEVTR